MTQAAQRKSQETADRIVDAIARLKAGRPEHPDLKARPLVRLSVHAVAVEAGVSRTALYRYHRQLLSTITEIARGTPAKGVASKRIVEQELRQRVIDLEVSLENALSENALLLHRLGVAEERLERNVRNAQSSGRRVQ